MVFGNPVRFDRPVSAALLGAACLALAASDAAAQAGAAKPEPLPEKMTGEQIKAAWFDGKPFNATSPDGIGFVMTFTPDGKASRKPLERKKGITNATGFWRVIAEGYCSRWSGQSREKCFNVRPAPEAGSVHVRFGTQMMATWSR